MKVGRSKEWWLEMAALEDDAEVGAGVLALESQSLTIPERVSNAAEIAFGRFIQLMRRKHGLSLEQLSTKVDVDLEELIGIEENSSYRPEPRTVYQLSNMFKVSNAKLLELAGLRTSTSDNLREEAVRFAARSESTERLTSIEKAALESFVAILSETNHGDNKKR
jgi:transcriptional regulator with XRE-family HTH domain